jgi:hypothetical protein
MSKSNAGRPDEAESYQAWRALTRGLVEQFHQQGFHSDEAKQVEAAIIDIVAEYLWLDLAERAAWDAFDPLHWRDTVAVSEPTYRSRVRATLINFYEHLTSLGLVSVPACSRIQEALAECLSDQPGSASVRSSYMRLAVDLDDESDDAVPFARRR